PMPYQYNPYELANIQKRGGSIPGGILGGSMGIPEYQATRGGGGGPGSSPADWLKAQREDTLRQEEEAKKPSQPTQVLYRRRDYIRSLMEGYGNTALEDESRQYGKEQGGLREDLRRRGLGSTTVQDAMTNRLAEA